MVLLAGFGGSALLALVLLSVRPALLASPRRGTSAARWVLGLALGSPVVRLAGGLAAWAMLRASGAPAAAPSELPAWAGFLLGVSLVCDLPLLALALGGGWWLRRTLRSGDAERPFQAKVVLLAGLVAGLLDAAVHGSFVAQMSLRVARAEFAAWAPLATLSNLAAVLAGLAGGLAARAIHRRLRA
jgi:hypothetical protein